MNSRLCSHSESSLLRDRVSRLSCDLAGSRTFLARSGECDSKPFVSVSSLKLLAANYIALLMFLLCILADFFSDERLFFELGTFLSFDELVCTLGRLPEDDAAMWEKGMRFGS